MTHKYNPICSQPLYIAVLIIFLLNLCLLVRTRAQVETDGVFLYTATTFIFASIYISLRRIINQNTEKSYLRIISCRLFEGIFFLQIAWINLRVLNHLSMMAPFSYSDELLHSWDKSLQINWLSYFEFVHSYPALIKIMDYSYFSLTPLSFIALLGIILFASRKRTIFFLEAFFVTAVICIIIGMVFPAKGAVVFLIENIFLYENYPVTVGSYHMNHLLELRSQDSAPELSLNSLPGLVTFPSFHTACGILLMVSFWRTMLFIPVSIYSLIMISSTPIFGGHYFVDIFAGALLALVVSYFTAKRVGNRSIFQPLSKPVLS